MVDYKKRLVEVDEILNYLPEEDYEKIPEDIKTVIKENKDKEYIWKYDETKKLKEQNLSRDTIIILSYINMEYLLNEEQKQLMEKIHEINDKKVEQQKVEQYEAKDLFEKKNANLEKKQKIEENLDEEKKEIEQNKELVIYNESIFTKIINKLKSFFERFI